MTEENASSTNPGDLAQAMQLLEQALMAVEFAHKDAKEAHNEPAQTDEEAEKVYAKLEVVGQLRNRATENAEAACRILARLAALRD
jgi:hypothetical protein